MKPLRLALLSLLPALLSCDSGVAPPTPVDFEHVSGGYGAIEPAAIVFRSGADWASFYTGAGQPVPDAPADFATQMLIGVYYGMVGGCPQDVRTVEGIGASGGELFVDVAPLPSLGDCEAAALFPAFDLVRLAAHDEPVRFTGSAPRDGYLP